MGRPFTFDVPDLSGGLNQGDPANIADTEWAVGENFYVQGQSAVSRRGMVELDEVGEATYSGKITDIARYRPGYTTEEYIICGADNGLVRVAAGAIVALAVADGLIYPTLDVRWWHEQYGDEMFWCRRGNGGVKRVYGDASCDAGMAPPLAAPVVTDGGPGKKEGGTYQYAVRFKNRITGARSNWGPWSNEVTIEESRKVSMTSVATSISPQCNAREIGATRADGGVIYLVGQIDDNVTTIYTDNANDDEYGQADVDPNGDAITDYRHGTPPDQAWVLATHKERLFVLNGTGLYWSEPGWMQSFKAASFYPIQSGTGLFSWQGRGLVIMTEMCGAQILEGDTPSDWRTDTGNLSKEHGSPAGKSITVADGVLYWYTGTNLVRSGGGPPEILPRIDRVRDVLDAIPEADKADVFAETIPSRGVVIFSVPQGGEARTLIVFDYKQDTFTTFDSDELPIQAMARLGRTNKAEAVLVGLYDADTDLSYLAEFLSEGDDWGTPIVCTLRTKSYGYDRGVADKVTNVIKMLTNRVNAVVTIKVYHDEALVYTLSGVSLNSEGWKAWRVDTAGTPGALVAVEIVYQGTPELRIDQLQIEGVNLLRRVVPA